MQWEMKMQFWKNYLEQDRFGRTLAEGWHVRLSFIREWGKFADLKYLMIKTN